MRNGLIMIATLAMATLAATPAVSTSFETGYLGSALATAGLIKREAPATCKATASDFQDGIAIVMGSNGRFKEATRIGDDSDNYTCIN